MELTRKISSQDHAEKLLQQLSTFRDSYCFCDIVVVVQNLEFNAHRAILAASSPYFLGMLTCGLMEGQSSRIEIHFVKAVVFKELLNFIYSGNITIRKENVQDTLVAADMLQLQDVVTACCKFIKEELNPENCVGILLLAERYFCKDLANSAEAFICNHFPKVIDTEEYVDLHKDSLLKFLHSEKIKITCEMDTLRAAIKWINHDAQRAEFTQEILAAVRFALIRSEEVDGYLSTIKDERLSVTIQVMVQEAVSRRKAIRHNANFGVLDNLVLPRICARKSIYVIGGFNRDPGKRWSDSCTLACGERFDFVDMKWHRLPSMRLSRNGHGVVVLDGLILSICGESDGMLFGNVEIFDPVDMQWSFSLAQMSQCACIMGMCAFNHSAYIFGGLRESGASDSVDKYCPERKTFQSYAKMTNRRCAMGVASHKGLIYLVGGKSELHPESELATMESFNPVTKEWSRLADLQIRRVFLSVAVLDDHLYAIGGTNEYGCSLSSVERYDFEEDTWETVGELTVPRAASCAASVNGKIVVVGGRSSGDEFAAPTTYSSIEWYSPETDQWVLGESMHKSRCEAGIVIL